MAQHVDVSDLPIHKRILRILMITIGAIGMSLSLVVFFLPSHLIDGGVAGISLIANHYFEDIPLMVFLAIFNLPFIYFGYKQIGKTFALSSLYAISVMSISTYIFKDLKPLTDEPLLNAIFGGICIGSSIGLILKSNSILDGIELSALYLSSKTKMSVGNIILIINCGIFFVGAFVFGFENAMFSIIAFYVASKFIDMIAEGYSDMKMIMIISEKTEDMAEEINARLGRTSTFLSGMGSYSKFPTNVLMITVSRLEETKLKDIVNKHDSSAFWVVTDAVEVHSGSSVKKDIH